MEKPFTWKWGTARAGLTESNENIHIENTFSRIFFHSMYDETREKSNNNNISRCQTSLPFNFSCYFVCWQMSPFFLAWNLLHNWQLSRQFFISKRRRQKCLPVQCAVLSNSMPTYKFTMRHQPTWNIFTLRSFVCDHFFSYLNFQRQK